MAITWVVAGVVLSVSTIEGQRLLETYDFTTWSSWALPLAVDCGLGVALIADQALSRHGIVCGWGTALRYSTVGYALLLNTGGPVLDGDGVRIVLHAIPPALLLTVVEAATAYQRLLGTVPGLSSQLTEELAPDPDPLVPVVAATVRDLTDAGKSPSRDNVGDELRRAGHAVSTARLSHLVRTVRQQPELATVGGE